MHKDMFKKVITFKRTPCAGEAPIEVLLQISKSKSIYTRVRLFARKGDFVMGITVLIVTAVSTSYKREAWKVRSTRLVFWAQRLPALAQ